jgi:hypothetical protein
MDSEELSCWIAYDRLDRIPDHYWLAAMTTSAVVNALTGSKTKPDDFIPRARPVRILSGEAGMAWFAGIAKAQNAKVARDQAASLPIHPH